MYYVYKITNSINDKVYIGITTRTVQGRWMEHVSRSRYPNEYKSAIHSAIRKYGQDSFKVEEICCTKSKKLGITRRQLKYKD